MTKLMQRRRAILLQLADLSRTGGQRPRYLQLESELRAILIRLREERRSSCPLCRAGERHICCG